MKTPACWLAVHLPALPIESLAALAGPEQSHRPLALLDKGVVRAVDSRAWQVGVRPGQRRATALALEPTLLLGRADPARVQEALRTVAHAALQFTPCVEEIAPHTVLMEVAATRRLFAGLERLLQRLSQTLAPLGHQTRMACAPTALGAAVLARWEEWKGHQRAAAATDSPPPNAGQHVGLHALSLHDLRCELAEVPLACWCESLAQQQMLQMLLGMGLRNLGDLQALPRAGLARRTGTELLRQLDQAWGDAPQSHRWVTLPDSFEARLELLFRADSTDQLLHGAQRLLERLVHWAQARQARVLRFTLNMVHEARHRQTQEAAGSTDLTVTLAQPSVDAPHLQALLRERLAQLALPAPTLELHLRCDEWVCQPPPEGELFPTPGRALQGLTQLVEHLQARLGKQRVCGLLPLADHRPERSAHWSPCSSPSQSGPSLKQTETVKGPSAPSSAPPHLTRPAWLLPEPRPLPEAGGRPLLNGQPLRLLAGPERIEAGWWEGAAAARDYFVAATPEGVLVWIFRARVPQPEEPQGWALQGWFG